MDLFIEFGLRGVLAGAPDGGAPALREFWETMKFLL